MLREQEWLLPLLTKRRIAIDRIPESLSREARPLEKLSDPRVFFAAERTLLAWVRTGLTVIALGFIVARFGLFLHLLAGPGGMIHRGSLDTPHWPSGLLGVVLVLSGSVIILGAFLNHRRYVNSLPQSDLPPLSLPWLSSFLSLSIVSVGVLLAVYLLFI